MIQFRQKTFSEYDAMRSLYVELMKYSGNNKDKFTIIDQKALIPILRGNNVVIERFVISTYFLRKDRYRMYLKIGAKAKMPDDVRLPQTVYDKKVGEMTLKIGSGGNNNNNNNNQGNQGQHNESLTCEKSIERIKLFSLREEQREFKHHGGGGGGQQGGGLGASIGFTPVSLQYQVRELLGDALLYNKKERSLVLEFDSINDAIKALNILPFGINYRIYLLA